MNKIKQTRLEKGLSIEDTSYIFGLDESEYLAIEEDYSCVSAYLIYKISVILGIDFLQL